MRVVGIVRLVTDPELKDAGGTPVVNQRVAYNTRRKVDGEWAEVGNFINVTIFGKQAENFARYMAKGREVLIDGRLEIHEFEHNGEKRSAAEIVADNIKFVGGAGSDAVVSADEPTGDDEIPF